MIRSHCVLFLPTKLQLSVIEGYKDQFTAVHLELYCISIRILY